MLRLQFQEFTGLDNTGGIDHVIGRAGFLQQFSCNRGDLLAVGNIQLKNANHLACVLAGCLYLRLSVLQLVDSPGGNPYVCAAGGKLLCQGQANAAGSASDENKFVVEIDRHGLLMVMAAAAAGTAAAISAAAFRMRYGPAITRGVKY